jgi:hypothetical protein
VQKRFAFVLVLLAAGCSRPAPAAPEVTPVGNLCALADTFGAVSA